uniref:Fiber protein Fb34 n=1 Tax=Kalanchoe fedtschenkoi TaxID=63787 RepID=A0A7N0SWH9_KALFE
MASGVLCLVVSIINVIAFGLAVAAEQRRSKANIVRDNDQNYNYCVYDSDIATGFGVGAFFLLLLTQIIVMIASRCLCCGKGLSPGGSRAWAVIFFIFSWIAFFIAEACLLAGSVQNAYHTKYRFKVISGDISCEMLRKGVFAAGAAFIIFTNLLSQFYYMCYSKANRSRQGYP